MHSDTRMATGMLACLVSFGISAIDSPGEPQSRMPGREIPPAPVVNPAEWEPMSGVLIRYGVAGGVPLQLIQEIAEDAIVFTLVESAEQQAQAEAWYGSNGVNMANCQWLIAPPSTALTRDYGPWYIFTGDGIQGIADNICGSPVDDLIPGVIGDSLNIPVYQTSLVIPGGNYMSDGMGIAMSEEQVLDQNPGLTPEQVRAIMHDYLGIETYHILNHLGSTAHIDTWGKLLDPGTILLKRFEPPNPVIEQMAEYLGSLKSSYGTPYNVVRVTTSYDTGYTNSLILNHKVLVPLFGHPLDDDALQSWAVAMPGYEIVGIPGGGWGPGNALHCRTMGVTDRYMLRIAHVPLRDRENNGEDYRVQATIHAYSGEGLLAGMPRVVWRTGAGAYENLVMTQVASDSFQAWVPQQPDGTMIQYYLDAADSSGRDECHPYVGAAHPHCFSVGPDTIPPTVDADVPAAILASDWPLTVSAAVRDDRSVSAVYVDYRKNGGQVLTVPMGLRPQSAVWYDAVLNGGSVASGDVIELRVTAVDGSTAQNTTTDPPSGWRTVSVVGSADACVWNPSCQTSGQLFFQRLQDAGVSSIYTESEPEAFGDFDKLFVFLGIWPSVHALSIDQVDSIVAYIASGHPVYIEGGDCWAYHPYHDLLGAAFGIHGLDDGDPIQNPILGVDSTFTEGMSYHYINPSGYIDVIEAIDGGDLIFRHDALGYGVARAVDSLRTVGLCFEFGGLAGNDAVSSQQLLLEEILGFFAGPSMGLWGEAQGGGLALEWAPCPAATAYWIYGAVNEPFFQPGFAPGYMHRLAEVDPDATTWWTSLGIGVPDSNWTYLVVAVGSIENEIARTTRVGEYEYEAGLP